MNALRLRNDVTLVPVAAAHRPRIAEWRADAATLDDWLRRALSHDGLDGFAILAGAEPVGILTLERGAEPALTIRLSVLIGDPARRGRGLGAAAVWLACDHAFTVLARRKVWLTVAAANRRAVGLYLRLGFRIEGRQRQVLGADDPHSETLYMGLFRRTFPPAEFVAAEPP